MRPAILVPTLIACLSLAACEESVSIGGGTLSKSEVEDGASKALTKEVGQAPTSFVCPGDLDAKVGATETCVLTDKTGAEYDTTVKVTSVSEDDSTAEYDVQVADKPNPSG